MSSEYEELLELFAFVYANRSTLGAEEHEALLRARYALATFADFMRPFRNAAKPALTIEEPRQDHIEKRSEA